MEQKAVERQYETVLTIEEASFQEKQHESIDNEHPYHMDRKPTMQVILKGRVEKTVRALRDTGASSSLVDYAFAEAILGEEKLSKQLYTEGYLLTFRTADSRYTSLRGQLRLQFEMGGQ